MKGRELDPLQVNATDCADVLILGAGFSRALSDSMPLTDELGNLCLEHDRLRQDDRVPDQGFHGGSFETWLSRLADEQPYLSVQENLENQALFLRFSAAIAEVLGQRVHSVLDAGWPSWFPEFLRVAHQRRSTVITFNYDPLIECAVGTGLLDDWDTPEPVFWAEVLGDIPAWPPGAAILGASPAKTFRLLKLHGSLNWYWSPGDATGVSVARRVLPGVYGQPEAYTEDDRQRELPGRVPFVVPPAATKSLYYHNPLIREIWRQAAASLRRAKQVTIVGYSLPTTDLTVSGLLVDALRGSDASILVVDVSPDGVVDRLISLGFPEHRIKTQIAQSEQPVSSFVAEWRNRAGITLVRELESATGDRLDSPLLVYWGRDAVARVTTVEPSGDGETMELLTDVLDSFQQATQSDVNQRRPELPILRDVLIRAAGRRLVVRGAAGEQQTLIDSMLVLTDVGYGTGKWNVFTPSGSRTAPAARA